MNIAYLISAHTDPAQLQRLVAALGPKAHCFIHIDRKSDITAFTALVGGENVHFLERRTDVRWGTINEWDYQLALIEAAIGYPLHFDRLVTLSGLDYPLWSNQRIEAYFEEQGERQLLAAMPLKEDLKSAQIFRVPRPYTTLPLIGNRGNQRLSILLRKIIAATGYRKKFTFKVNGQEWREYKGAAWWAISEEMARYVADTYHKYERDIRSYFRHQHCPAETLLQTIAFNSPEWRGRCILFPCGDQSSLEEKTLLHHIEYTDAIRIWEEKDYDVLMRSGKMFTRKLTSARSQGLVKLIDKNRAQ